ncbi:MAG: YfiR family protein [Betaproteobacteria bacterium]|nr:YfiR family protein [Betaproteobacteria bacterium]
MGFGRSTGRMGRGALLLALLLGPGFAQTAVPIEQLRAAFLYNFALFVYWPAPPTGEFDLCLYGANPAIATETLAGKRVGGAALRVRRPANVSELRGCQVLYIDGRDRAALARAREAVATLPVLTVSEASEFNDRPAMINLIVAQGRIAFDIDTEAAGRAGIQVSSRLLRLARKVY